MSRPVQPQPRRVRPPVDPSAHVSLIEPLEVRRLMHAGLQVSVNFQPAQSDVPDGFVADVGHKFGDRGDGLRYGWNRTNTRFARDRVGYAGPAPEYLTHQDMYRSDGGSRWEIAVPNGAYHVRVVAGDPTRSTADYRIAAEGVRILKGQPTSANRWVEGAGVVTVADGRLTLTNARGAVNNRICFVEITEQHDPHDDPTARPTVSVSAAAPRTTEGATAPGTFFFSRTGDTSRELIVHYVLGGTATQGEDYAPLGGTVVFAAGTSEAQVDVIPLADDQAEADETVTLTLATPEGADYGAGATFAATVKIEDAARPVQPTVLRWRKVADAPIARGEASGATVGGRLYVFGGYVDSTYWPTRRADAFDPAANQWTRLADLPVGLTHAATAVDGTDVYLVGGYPEGPRSQTFGTDAVYRYDTVANAWSTMPKLPQARGGGAAAIVGRHLHFFGGSDLSRQDRSEHWSLDLDNPAAGWVAQTPMTNTRNHLAAATIGGRVYAIGGQNGQDASATMRSLVNTFDAATGAWSTVASLQPARSHISHSTAVTADGRLLVMGGEAQGGVRIATVSAYDPATDQWSDLTPLPAVRKSGVGGVVGDVLVFTGGNSSGLHRATWIGEFV